MRYSSRNLRLAPAGKPVSSAIAGGDPDHGERRGCGDRIKAEPLRTPKPVPFDAVAASGSVAAMAGLPGSKRRMYDRRTCPFARTAGGDVRPDRLRRYRLARDLGPGGPSVGEGRGGWPIERRGSGRSGDRTRVHVFQDPPPRSNRTRGQAASATDRAALAPRLALCRLDPRGPGRVRLGAAAGRPRRSRIPTLRRAGAPSDDVRTPLCGVCRPTDPCGRRRPRAAAPRPEAILPAPIPAAHRGPRRRRGRRASGGHRALDARHDLYRLMPAGLRHPGGGGTGRGRHACIPPAGAGLWMPYPGRTQT